jgi:hypothetical protein
VRIIVGFAPGQAIDIVTRIVGQWLSEQLGQQFIIENRPGAGGNIAAEAVVRAPPNGYTLLAIGSNKRSAGAVNALSTRDPHDLMKESRTVGHDGRAPLLPFEAVTFARQADQPTRAPNQADRTPCYHRFESKNRSARNPDSGPVRQPPKQRRAATVMEGANAIIDPARSSGPRAGHGARGGVGSGAIARGRRHPGWAELIMGSDFRAAYVARNPPPSGFTCDSA